VEHVDDNIHLLQQAVCKFTVQDEARNEEEIRSVFSLTKLIQLLITFTS